MSLMAVIVGLEAAGEKLKGEIASGAAPAKEQYVDGYTCLGRVITEQRAINFISTLTETWEWNGAAAAILDHCSTGVILTPCTRLMKLLYGKGVDLGGDPQVLSKIMKML
jgi:hypothetical protein